MSDDINKFWHHMFIAVPELAIDDIFVRFLRKENLINAEGDELISALRKQKGKIERLAHRGKKYTTFTRIMAIAPSVMTLEMAEILHKTGFLKDREYSVLRQVVGVVGGALGKEDNRDVALRAARLLGVNYMENLTNLMVAEGLMTVRRQRDVMIFAHSSTRVAEGFLSKSLRTKKLVDLLLLTGSSLLSEDMLRALRISGVINVRTANALLESAKYGSALWTVFEGSKRAEGLAARMAYVVSGSFSWEGLRLVQSLGNFKKRDEYLMKIAVALSQSYNRRLMEQMTARRFRVMPSETPLQTYIRTSKKTDKELLRLLSAASKEASKEAAQMTGLSAAQRKIRVATLHRSMREIWEGVGHLTIFGEVQAAEAAVEATQLMQKAFRRNLDDDTLRMIDFASKSGIDSYLSRKENTMALSRRVYGNYDLMTGKLNKKINIHLLKGSNANTFAMDIRRFISPTTPGGVNYAAMRLARTEIANAFHQSTIRNGREMPWVIGWKWNLSESHGKPDECNQYSSEDHGLGPGVFKKANVPGKPHPGCLCYLTAHQPDEETFIQNMNKGYYNRYLNTVKESSDVKASGLFGVSDKLTVVAGNIVVRAAATSFTGAVSKARS